MAHLLSLYFSPVVTHFVLRQVMVHLGVEKGHASLIAIHMYIIRSKGSWFSVNMYQSAVILDLGSLVWLLIDNSSLGIYF